VRVHSETCVNLQVFTDDSSSGTEHRIAAFRGEGANGPDTWHWPEREEEPAKAARAYEPGEAVPA